MKKILFLIALLSCLAYGVQRTWSSSGSTDANDGANYDGSGDILATDTLLLNNTSVVNWTMTAALSVAAITVAANYSGAVASGGFAIKTAGSQTYDGTGTLNFGSTTDSITGDGSFHIGSGVGTVTMTSTFFDILGTGNWDIDKVVAFPSVKFAYTGKTTTLTNGVATSSFNLLNINSGALVFSNSFYLVTTTADFLTIGAGSTITCSGTNTIYIRSAVNGTINIPAITIAGSGALTFEAQGTTGTTFSLGGALSAGAGIGFYGRSNGANVYNTNNYGLTCLGFDIGHENALGADTIKLGSSNCSFTSITNASYTNAHFLNMGSASVTVTGAVTIGTNCTVVPGTSALTLSGTTTSAITSRGEAFNNIIINKTGTADSVRLLDSLQCCSLTVTDGRFRQNLQNMRLSGSLDFNAADTVILNDTITMTGDGGRFDLDGAGPKVLTSSALFLNNNATVMGNFTIPRLKLTAGKTYTMTAGDTVTVSAYTAGDWSGSASSWVTLQSSSAGTRWLINAPASTSVTWCKVKDSNNIGTAINALGAGNIDLGNNLGWNFAGGALMMGSGI